MKLNHTPAPWEFVAHGPDSEYFGNILGHYGKNQSGIKVIRTITVQLKYGAPEENMANALLIEAAPHLLKALMALEVQALQSELNSPNHEWGMEALSMAREAIVMATNPKAKG